MPGGLRLQSLLVRRAGQLGDGTQPRIDTHRAAERIGITQSLGGTAAERGSDQIVQQLHAGVHVVAHAIPLDHREFGIVQRTTLGAAKRPRDLIDRRRAGGQQSLHAVLGGRLQPIHGSRSGQQGSSISRTLSGSRCWSTTVSADNNGVSTSRNPRRRKIAAPVATARLGGGDFPSRRKGRNPRARLS